MRTSTTPGRRKSRVPFCLESHFGPARHTWFYRLTPKITQALPRRQRGDTVGRDSKCLARSLTLKWLRNYIVNASSNNNCTHQINIIIFHQSLLNPFPTIISFTNTTAELQTALNSISQQSKCRIGLPIIAPYTGGPNKWGVNLMKLFSEPFRSFWRS